MPESHVEQFTVLMVCTGNIGRSPMMEQLMRRELAERGADHQVVVASAGTWGQAGHPMEPGAMRALADRGLVTEPFAATPLTEAAVTASDLILVATRDHRSEVVGMVPGSVRRTFTLHEFARLAATAPPLPGEPALGAVSDTGQMRDAVAWVAQLRGSLPRPDREEDDDLPDPMGAPDEVYRQRAAAIASSVERIVPYLLGSTSAG